MCRKGFFVVILNRKVNLKTIGRLSLEALKTYFRVEVEGVENIPTSGRAILAPNHSGYIGVDAIILTSVVKRETKRRARILAHRAYFDLSEKLGELSKSFGLKRASVEDGVETLKLDQLLLLFPEGEAGNFKSTLKKYQLQKFKTGFLRMAIETQSPVVPVLILGAEETHLNLGNFDFTGLLKNVRVPLPLNLVPLPAKWKIIFLPAIKPESFSRELLNDPKALRKEAARIQKQMQKALNQARKGREYIYSAKTRELIDRFADLAKNALAP